jgi:hypothetical protein
MKVFTGLSLSVGDVIQITWRDRDPALTLDGHVVYVKSDHAGLFAGVRFVRLLSLGAFQELREHRSVTAYARRRGGSAS